MYYIDSREKVNTFANYLTKQNIPFQHKQLPVGDVLFQDEVKTLIFERKRVDDFVGSFQEGRLQEQVLNMEENYPHRYIVVVGKWDDLRFNSHYKFLTTNQRLGMLASLLVRFNTKIVQVENETQFAKIVLKIVEKTNDGKSPYRPAVRKVDKVDIYLSILCQVPNISMEKAKGIKKQYPSLPILQRGLKDGVFKVFGIGVTTKEHLEKALL